MRAAGAARSEPALGFWLDLVEAEGGVWEDEGDRAVALLPGPLVDGLDLPEEVAVTADPEVAREEGALLLIPGHPALDRAAASVLARGDAGRSHLAWPASQPPTPGDLVARAREAVGVEHGRIDPGGHPREVYLPLLRLGAAVTYTVSLEDRFQERQEVWVDARTGLALPEEMLRALRSQPQGAGGRFRPVLSHDLSAAVAAAHRLIEARAAGRCRVLAGQSSWLLRKDMERAAAYYDAVLKSIDGRMSAASEERREALAAQAEATRAERARRLREIEESFEPRHDVRPFRLHLVLAPALELPATVRRGARTFPLSPVWILAAGAFAAVPCPHCGRVEALVAGRERLGCRGCLPRPALEAAAAPPPRPARPGPAPAKAAPRDGPPPSPPAPPPRPAPPSRRSAAGRAPRPPSEASPNRATRLGYRLAVDVWRSALEGRRWRGKATVAGSPMEALVRIYGAEGPLVALGMPPGALPEHVSATTPRPGEGSLSVTYGDVLARGVEYPYTLLWRSEAGKPLVAEVLPGDRTLDMPWGIPRDAWLRLMAPPSPGIPLDPLASVVWEGVAGSNGLPLAVRCLALCWRAQSAGGLDGVPARAAAAGVAILAARGGRSAGYNWAEAFGVEKDAASGAARALRRLLGPDGVSLW